MAIRKFASLEQAQVLDLKGSKDRSRTASLDKISEFNDYRTEDGYLYARIRAISSRVNKNHDGWPSFELAGGEDIFKRHSSSEGGFTVEASNGAEYGFATFLGKPIFVDHNNSNPERARGVIVDAKLHVEDHRTAAESDPYYASAPDNHMPPTWVELLLEVDAKSFPKLAQAIIDGSKNSKRGIDGFSMGCDVEKSICNICKNAASAPDEYCKHVKLKGAEFDWVNPKTGHKESKKSYEDCYGIKFFEISAVFDPADETALVREVRSSVQREAALPSVRACHYCGSTNLSANSPSQVMCEDCHATYAPASLYDPQVHPAHNPADPRLVGASTHQGAIMTLPCPNCGNPNAQLNTVLGHGDCMACGKSFVNPQGGSMNPNPSGGVPGAAPPIHGNVHTAEHPVPQSDMMTAPEYVDTLREEEICPVCGSSMDEGHQCEVCGYVAPPEGLDNPDLDKAQGTNLLQDPQDLGNPAQNIDVSTHPATPDPAQPTNNQVAASVNNEMAWQIHHPKLAGKINSVERPIQVATRPATNEPRETIISDQTKPVTNRTAASMIAAVNQGEHMSDKRTAADAPTADTRADKRVDATGVGGVMDANNESASKADLQTNVEGKGGIVDSSNEEASRPDHTESLPTADRKGDDAGFNKDKTTDDSGKTRTFDNSNEPNSAVTNQAFPTSSWKIVATDDKVFPAEDGGLSGGSAKQGVQPVDPVGKADDRVDVLDHVTSPNNNSGPTKTWTGTGGNGVTKQQDAVTREVYAPWTASVVDILKIADTEVELGIINAEQKYDRIAELERETPEVVQTTAKVLSRVKTAGLKKSASVKQGGVGRVPSFRSAATTREASVEADESLFL